MIKDLIALANHLDDKGLTKEADTLDKIITKIAQEDIPKIGKHGMDDLVKFLHNAFRVDGAKPRIESFYNEYKPEAYEDLEMKDDEYGAFAVPPENTDNIEKTVYTVVGCDERCFDHLKKSSGKIPRGNTTFDITEEEDGRLRLFYGNAGDHSSSKFYMIHVEKKDNGETLICTAARADYI